MASVLYDPIMAALLTLLQTSCGSLFKTYSRRFMTWEDLQQQLSATDAVRQPALYLYSGPGFGGGTTKYIQQGRTPAKRIITRTIVLYAQIPGGGLPGGIDSTTAGDAPFYPLIEAVESALEPADSDSLATITLGGLVTHCWIEGDGVIVPGDIDPNGQGMATLPVTILIP
jgi:hypothetical protein